MLTTYVLLRVSALLIRYMSHHLKHESHKNSGCDSLRISWAICLMWCRSIIFTSFYQRDYPERAMHLPWKLLEFWFCLPFLHKRINLYILFHQPFCKKLRLNRYGCYQSDLSWSFRYFLIEWMMMFFSICEEDSWCDSAANWCQSRYTKRSFASLHWD